MFWKSAFTHLCTRRRREIIRERWRMPMAAMNLAARVVQSAFRGYLIRRLLSPDGSGDELISAIERKCKERAARRDAALTTKERAEGDTMTGTERFQERVVAREGVQDIRGVAASLVQAAARGYLARKRWSWYKHDMYHIAAMEIQYAFRCARIYRRERGSRHYTVEERDACAIVQRAWTRHRDVRAYRSLRTICCHLGDGDPRVLLRTLSPDDVYACDPTMKSVVRLRLGGTRFPPTIYFKVFTRSAVCDVNAFAPRNYAKEREGTSDDEEEDDVDPTSTENLSSERRFLRVGKTFVAVDMRPNVSRDGWYERVENNGWRPIFVSPEDEIALEESDVTDVTRQQGCRRHQRGGIESKCTRSKLRSHRDVVEARKRKRREWMMKLYASRRRSDAKRDDETHEWMDDNEDDEAVRDMIEWARDLDFEGYAENWSSLGTTRPSGPEGDNPRESPMLYSK